MNGQSLRGALLAFSTLVGVCAVGAEEVAQVPPLIQQLSSESLDVRREAARQFEPNRIGQLDPQLAVRAALIAAKDADPWIRGTTLAGLGLLTASMVDGGAVPTGSRVAEAINASPELRPTLEGIVRDDPSIDVVLTASVPFMTIFGKDPRAEAIVLDRTDKVASPVDQVTLMDRVAIGGIDADETFERLARYLDVAPPIVQLKAAQLLLTRSTLPKDRLEDFLRIMETPETFADPLLLRALPRFGVSPATYLSRLVAMRERLEEELQRPEEQRTCAVYNDEYWIKSLDEAIAAARKSIQTGAS